MTLVDAASPTSMSGFELRQDDLSGVQTRALLEYHLRQMHANSPPGSVFALDLSGLQTPDITVWSAWRDEQLFAIGALKQWADGRGELKSMRAHPERLRQGAAAAVLEHIIGAARARGLRCLSLETGSGDAFEAALALYRRRGFRNGPAFGDYTASPFNQFLHLPLV